jgi:hypothetical protein
MLSLASLLLVIASVAIYWLTLKAGVYRRIPYEHYLLLSGSIGGGFYAWLQDPSWVTGAPPFIAALVAGFLVWYVHVGTVFPRSELHIKVGDRFPDFSLPDSDGKTVTANDLGGKRSALYLFYRGDW